MKVLLTGFGPYPGVPWNATSALVPRLAETLAPRRDIHVTSAILPTDWQAAPKKIKTLFDHVRPVISLHLGVSSCAEAAIIETSAYNEASGKDDINANTGPGCHLHPDLPSTLTTTAPIAEIASRLEKGGHRFERSNDPGRFLCNAVYYEALHAGRLIEPATQSLFVHLPCFISGLASAEADAIPKEERPAKPMDCIEAIGTLCCILDALCQAAQRRRQP